MGNMAASVFPIPVGATRRRFSPFRIRGMESACGGVGSVIPLEASAEMSSGDSWGNGMKNGKGRGCPLH